VVARSASAFDARESRRYRRALEHRVHAEQNERGDLMRAQDLMTSPAITCHVNDPLNSVAKKMWDADIGVLPVVNDDGKLTGMITDRDICMAAYTQGRPLDELLVNSAMAMHAITARPETFSGELEALMAKHQVRRIPIVDADNRPIGIVSLNDLAIECAQPDTRMKNGPAKVAHTLAAICQHRAETQQAA
jgi:CBS domain-containing protein